VENDLLKVLLEEYKSVREEYLGYASVINTGGINVIATISGFLAIYLANDTHGKATWLYFFPFLLYLFGYYQLRMSVQAKIASRYLRRYVNPLVRKQLGIKWEDIFPMAWEDYKKDYTSPVVLYNKILHVSLFSAPVYVGIVVYIYYLYRLVILKQFDWIDFSMILPHFIILLTYFSMEKAMLVDWDKEQDSFEEVAKKELGL
jgi:hypothetical protein